MKIATILLLAGLQVTANGWGQEKINLAYNNASLELVFNAITAQTNIAFLYRPQYIKGKTVSINITNASLKTALDLCLKGQQLSYEVIGKNVAIRPVKKDNPNAVTEISEIAPPLIDIRGRVVNERGEPVVDVTVTIKGTNVSTSTDANGEFSLHSIEQNAVLVFTHISMESFEVKVSGRADLAINLKTKVTALGEVNVRVNTGYQKISKERFVGSFAQLDSQSFHRRAGMNIIDRLDGTVSGVLFNRKGSGQQYPIQIRGISTLGGALSNGTNTEPLIVVDNFPVSSFDLNNFNPNDVESVTVLKDAAALSIWGARGGNGVIVVTTKKGNYNRRFNLSLSSNVTVVEKPDLYALPRISTSDFIDVESYLYGKGFYDGALNTRFSFVSPVVEILAMQKAGVIAKSDATAQIDALRNNDIRDEMDKHLYRNEVRQQHYLSFNGGTNVLSYQLSAGLNHSLNNIQGSKPDNQYTINTNTSFRPNRNLEISAGFNYAYGMGKSNNYQLPVLSPYTKLVDDQGNPAAVSYDIRQGYKDTVGGGKLLDWNYRPLDEARLANVNSVSRLMIMSMGVNYKVTNWLSADVRYQFTNRNTSFSNYQSQKTYVTRNLINRFTNFSQTNPNLRYPVPVGGILDLTSSQSKTDYVRGSLQFNKNWSSRHQLIALIGGEITDSKGGYTDVHRVYGYNELNGSARTNIDYYNQYPQTYAANPGTTALLPVSDSYLENGTHRFVSAMGNVAYTYQNRYNFYVSARKDGANLFGVKTNNKWKPIWSAGAAWEISRESFFKIDWLPFLKVRASHGYTGNVNSNFSGLFTMQYLSTVDFLTGLSIAQAGNAPNENLRWEQIGITNYGLDFQLFKNRLSGSIEYFTKKSNDIISLAPMPASSGVVTFTLNNSDLKTKGFEINLSSRNCIIGSFGWSTTVGVAYSKTIIGKLYSDRTYKTAAEFLSYGLNPSEGKIAFGISSYRWAGLDPATGDPMGYWKGQVSKNYQGIFQDTLNNQVFHGSSIPLYNSFMRNDFTWKGLTVSFNITGRFNYYFREPALNILYSATVGVNDFMNYTPDYLKRWRQPGDESFTNVPSMVAVATDANRAQFYRMAEIHVKRADNIRLQDISLSYQWNNGNKKIPLQSVRFFFYPNNLNLILWRAEASAYDPEFSGGVGGVAVPPAPKTWTTGIAVNF